MKTVNCRERRSEVEPIEFLHCFLRLDQSLSSPSLSETSSKSSEIERTSSSSKSGLRSRETKGTTRGAGLACATVDVGFTSEPTPSSARGFGKSKCNGSPGFQPGGGGGIPSGHGSPGFHADKRAMSSSARVKDVSVVSTRIEFLTFFQTRYRWFQRARTR